MSTIARDVFVQVQRLMDAGEPFVIVTLLSTAGHAPQDPGAKALVTAQGLLAGTVGGGKIEAKAISLSLDLIGKKNQEITGSVLPPIIQKWDLQKDVGMSCGGTATLLFEGYGTRPWSIAIFGAGHVAQALVRILLHLDCRITCIDPRPEWIEKLPLSPQLRTLCMEDPSSFVATLAPATYCAVVTKGHATDLPILEKLLFRSDLSYVGAIGSTVKARILRADLLKKNLRPEQIKRLHCPIGLPIGSNHPGEIAVSITAQLISARDLDSCEKKIQSRASTSISAL